MSLPARAKNSVQTLLESRGLSPRKIFGQNFMADSNFAAAIARDAKLDEHTLSIEAGPGTGLLTRAMLESHPAARVLAIEIDRGLASLLRESFAAEITASRLTLIEGDALDGKHAISQALCDTAQKLACHESRPRIILCANLPYNIATPFLANAAIDTQNLNTSCALATIQYELAERMLARSGDSNYGALSVLLALRATGRIARRAGPEIFWPRPKVDSAVIELNFKAWPETPSPDSLSRSEAVPFQNFLKKAFSQRRKTLRSLFKPARIPRIEGVNPNARAEALSPPQLLTLFRAMSASIAL